MLKLTDEGRGVWCVCGSCGHCGRNSRVRVTRSGAVWIVTGWRWFRKKCGHSDCETTFGLMLDEVGRIGGLRCVELLSEWVERRSKKETQDKLQQKMVFKYAA